VNIFGGSPPGSGPHLEDTLSAYLDDELAPAARREAEAHLAGCADCRDELVEVAAARQAIRIMPVHAAPRPLIDAVPLPAAASRRRAVWAMVAAAAAAVALVLPSREPEVAPSLPSLADSHAARASITGDPLTQLAPIAVPVRFGP
jgi:anti-sigma factor RsiW